ncbi:MAG: hypothetical protein M1813_006185 [Trichoglossum hirsutum]|nr:MAG: hypothetical protein M1813_006185 [Trichoglossum hirsutum]
MSTRTSYIPPSAETVLDFSDDDLPKRKSHIEPSVPLATTNRPSKRRERSKEKSSQNSSLSSAEKSRKKYSYRERERTATSPTPKSPSLVQGRIRQVFTYNFSEAQSEVGRKSPRPGRAAEVRLEDRLSRHRRTMSTGTLKSASTVSAGSCTENYATDKDKTVRRSSTAAYNTEKHRMSIGSTSPSVVSSASSSPSEATTTSSAGSSGSNSTVTQSLVVSRNPNRPGRPLDDCGRHPDGDITPRQREFPPVADGPPDVFSFMDSNPEVTFSHPSDTSSTVVENKSLVAVPQGYISSKNGESDASRHSNKIDFPPQVRGRKELAQSYWARREWFREQAEIRARSDSGQSPRMSSSQLRTPEYQATAVAHTPDGRGSPTGSTSSASDSTSGTVGDTDTTRSSSPERSPKGGDAGGESPTPPAKKISARAAFEPLLARQRERAVTTSAYPASSRSRQEQTPKSDAPHLSTSRSSPSGDVGGSARQSNQKPTSSPTTKRVSSSETANKNVQPSKSRELVSLPAPGNVAMKQKIFSTPQVNAPRARTPREVSPERFYRTSDASSHIPSDMSSSRPYPPPLPPEVYLTPPHMAQRGYSPQGGPPSDYLPMPMMVSAAGMGMPPYMAPPPSLRSLSPQITDEGKRSISGYELLASHLSSLCGGSGKTLVPIYRRFEALNHRLLLHLQDEVSELEEELRRVDEADAQARQVAAGMGAGLPHPASRRVGAKLGGDLEWKKLDILGRVFIKMGQYNQALSSYSKLVKNLDPASKEDIKRYKHWMTKHNPIAEPEARFLHEEADLLSVMRSNKLPEKPAPTRLSPRWSFLLGDGYMLVIAAAVLLPILAFVVVPGYLGRLAFVATVALATVALLGETKIACMMGGWEWGMSAATYAFYRPLAYF